VRAALYIRVSTQDQGDHGFSLRQQEEALREHCRQEGIEVVDVFQDQSSGADLHRPGLDSLLDLVADGGVDIVLAQDADRITRDPMHRAILDDEIESHGATLEALDDWGDDSDEGELLKYIRGWIAKRESLKTAERSHRGLVQKAREGKIPGSGAVAYGFRYEDGHYYVDEDRMVWVRKIFQMVADGHTLYDVVQFLQRNGVPTSQGGKWQGYTIRMMILNDTYAGTFYWGKTRSTYVNDSDVVNGQRIYKRKTQIEKRPRSEWIAISVPDSGIPPENIRMARKSLEGNTWHNTSTHSDLTWELSGGVGLCGECGYRLRTRRHRNSTGKKYSYYTCLRPECPASKYHPKEQLEHTVRDVLVETFRPDVWSDFVNQTCDRHVDELRNLHRSPTQSRERLHKRIGELQAKMDRTRELYTDGDYSKEEYEQKRDAILDQITTLQQELYRIDDLDGEMQRIDHLRNALLSIESPFSGHYVFTGDYIGLSALADSDLGYNPSYGSKQTAAKRRQEIYRKMRLCVRVEDDNLTLEISGMPVHQGVHQDANAPGYPCRQA
jgi:DNA invertase Pin-like site-specific DNA recombinase